MKNGKRHIDSAKNNYCWYIKTTEKYINTRTQQKKIGGTEKQYKITSNISKLRNICYETKKHLHFKLR